MCGLHAAAALSSRCLFSREWPPSHGIAGQDLIAKTPPNLTISGAILILDEFFITCRYEFSGLFCLLDWRGRCQGIYETAMPFAAGRDQCCQAVKATGEPVYRTVGARLSGRKFAGLPTANGKWVYDVRPGAECPPPLIGDTLRYRVVTHANL